MRWRSLMVLALVSVVALAVAVSMRTALLNSLLYFPYRQLGFTPEAAELAYEDVELRTQDGETLHAWWVPTRSAASRGHILFFHGNAGNIADRVMHARLLADAGFDTFLFDYRGYGRSTGRPSEQGTYRDARAARAALLQRPDVEPERVLYLGESLGGAVALELALEAPPRGLILQSTFTSVRDMRRLHYPFIPQAIVPDAYPSLQRIVGLRSPVLVLHGSRDEIVPLAHGQALFDAAPQPKQLHVFPGAGHNDLIALAGPAYAERIARWVGELKSS